ncbi:MAG TPA: type VI secretion system tube protein Hcp [Gemmataceae bacterium]|nr:type VI secretion system tube protein Hcp [Gemmataceae bacterium]
MVGDMFLKLSGIEGESKDHKHKGEIDIEFFNWNASQTAAGHTGGGHGAGKVSVSDITINKYLDKSSTALMLHCCNGKHIAEGLITVRKAGEKPLEYLKIKLTDVFIAAVKEAGHGGGDRLKEAITINFAKFHVEYLEQDEKGGGKPGGEMGWDIKANQKL